MAANSNAAAAAAVLEKTAPEVAVATAVTTSITKPRRYIYNDDDMRHFLASPCKSDLLKLTAAMGNSCAASQSTYFYDPKEPLRGLSPAMACLHGALGAMLNWVDTDFPATEHFSPHHDFRFGNPMFREWHQRLTERSSSIVAAILATSKHQKQQQQQDNDNNYDLELLHEASESGMRAAADSDDTFTVLLERHGLAETDRAVIEEVACYLHDAFGHPIRLDYGTGHETSFQIFLFALCKVHCFGSTPNVPPTVDRLKAVTLSLYHQYLSVTRKLQTDYMLEPAGSHGVWGLDDYHCLPFYFGACQLQQQQQHETTGENYTPASIHDDSVLQQQGETYLYFGCIRFIKSLKKGAPFFESSPMLNDISQMPTWSKVQSGLLKLYEGEVLSKRQVVQHLHFGTIFAANWTPSQPEPHQAPTENFRSKVVVGSTGVMARAPWATADDDDAAPVTKAPWST